MRSVAGPGFFAVPAGLAIKEVLGDDGGLCSGPALLILHTERYWRGCGLANGVPVYYCAGQEGLRL